MKTRSSVRTQHSIIDEAGSKLKQRYCTERANQDVGVRSMEYGQWSNGGLRISMKFAPERMLEYRLGWINHSSEALHSARAGYFRFESQLNHVVARDGVDYGG